MPPSLASGLRKLKSDGTGQCLYLVRYCCIAHRLHGHLLVSYYQLGMVADTCQDQRRGYLLFILSIFVARESQCLQWSRLAKFLGQAANFEVQLATTTQQQHNFAFYAASTCTWELCSGGGDLLKVQPGHGHSIGPRKLWTHLLQDDGEPEAGQSVQGS